MDSSTSLPIVHSQTSKKLASAFDDGKFTGSGSFQSHLSSIHTQQRIHTVRPSGSLPAVSSVQGSRLFTREKIGPPISCISAKESVVPGHKTHSYRLASFVRAHFTSVAPSPGSTWITPPSETLGKVGPHLHRPLGPASRVYPSSLRYMFYVYCCVSLVFFSASLYRAGAALQSPMLLDTASAHSETSYLDSLSVDARMARLSAIRPLPVSFEPNFFHLRPASLVAGLLERLDTVTACLWIQDDALDSHLLTTWMRRWPGPISMVVTTTSIPRAIKSAILAKLNGTFAASSSPKSNAMPNTTTIKPSGFLDISVHLLVLHPNAPPSPNAFLNLARLFARTSHVFLVPSLSSSIPDPESLASSLPSIPAITFSRNDTVLPLLPWTPALNPSGRAHTALPYPSLSPILLPRDYPTWCTERFASFPLSRSADKGGADLRAEDSDDLARAADWDHCLFQFWLDSFGAMDVLPALTIPAQGQTALQRPVRGPLSSTEIIHHRLATRFRGEACVLALKRLEALAAASSNAVVDDIELRAAKREKVARRGGINGGSVDVGNVRWLKRVCREWVNAS